MPLKNMTIAYSSPTSYKLFDLLYLSGNYWRVVDKWIEYGQYQYRLKHVSTEEVENREVA